MPIVGFNFDKILVERKNKITGKINIKQNLGIVGIEQEKLLLGNQDKEQVLKFNFNFDVNYENIGQITVLGHVLFLDESKKIKTILEDWKKKKIDQNLTEQILNVVLFRCTVKALTLAQEVNLPPPIRLPSIEKTKK